METPKPKLIYPYTNGIDDEITGYVDLFDIVDKAVKEAEKEIKKNKR